MPQLRKGVLYSCMANSEPCPARALIPLIQYTVPFGPKMRRYFCQICLVHHDYEYREEGTLSELHDATREGRMPLVESWDAMPMQEMLDHWANLP